MLFSNISLFAGFCPFHNNFCCSLRKNFVRTFVSSAIMSFSASFGTFRQITLDLCPYIYLIFSPVSLMILSFNLSFCPFRFHLCFFPYICLFVPSARLLLLFVFCLFVPPISFLFYVFAFVSSSHFQPHVPPQIHVYCPFNVTISGLFPCICLLFPFRVSCSSSG